MQQRGAQPDVRLPRYGRPSRSRELALRATVVMVAAAFLGWLVWAALAAATPDVRAQVLEFRVIDEGHVQASIEVIARAGSAVTCTVRAQDRSHETTGVGRVAVPARATARRVVRTVIETRSRAVVVTVVGCRLSSRSGSRFADN